MPLGTGRCQISRERIEPFAQVANVVNSGDQALAGSVTRCDFDDPIIRNPGEIKGLQEEMKGLQDG